ncbi:MAG: ABC transporter permease [Rubripirellula sp.]|nr:ABC transporter permease [Rubripirellula sp.]
MQAERPHGSDRKKACFSVPDMTVVENTSGVMGAPAKDSLVKRLPIQQSLATTLVVQRPLDSTPVVPMENMTPDVVIRTKRPPPDPTTPGVRRYGLTRGDFKNIESLVPSITVAVPFRTFTQSVRYADREQEVAVVGTTAKAAQTNEIVISSGRFLNHRDVEYRNNVAVITADIANRLFRDKNPIGRNLRVNDDYFLIVGVIETKKRTLQTGKPSNALRIYIPITTMNSRFGDQVLSRKTGSFLVEAYELSEMHLVLKNRDEIPIAVKKIRRLLAVTHETADYTVDVLKQ